MWPFTKKLSNQVEELKKANEKLSRDIDTFFDLITEDVLENHDLSLKNARIKLLSILYLIKNQKETTDLNNFVNTSLDNLHIEIYSQNLKYQDQIGRYKSDIEELRNEKLQLLDDVIDLRQEKLYQDFGLYTPIYNLMSSSEYRERLEICRQAQKDMIKDKVAAICNSEWRLNNNRREGIKMTNRNIKQIIRSFNTECDYLINKVKYYNVESIKKKIIKSFNDLNKLNEPLNIVIAEDYLRLKIEELCLCFEYADKKQQEREYMRIKKQEEKEQAALLKEIEEERKKLRKEQEHYQTHLRHIQEQIEIESDRTRLQFLHEKELETQSRLDDIENALIDVDYREANQKAGYVYVVSNIGAFGENVYKIGMTRRLDPQDRINELSGASVPFKFDVHAMIFSDDAPALEAAIHRELENKKVNLVNNRKEFFKVSLGEIKDIITRNYDKTVDFVDIPDAQQYRESVKIREIKSKP